MSADDWPRGWCAECLYEIVFDDVFGWLHDDRPSGESFHHRAVPLMPTETEVTP